MGHPTIVQHFFYLRPLIGFYTYFRVTDAHEIGIYIYIYISEVVLGCALYHGRDGKPTQILRDASAKGKHV